MTVHDVLEILRLHVSVPQCDVFGYLSIDHELVVLIVPVDQQPTPLQVTHTADTITLQYLCIKIYNSYFSSVYVNDLIYGYKCRHQNNCCQNTGVYKLRAK